MWSLALVDAAPDFVLRGGDAAPRGLSPLLRSPPDAVILFFPRQDALPPSLVRRPWVAGRAGLGIPLLLLV